MTNAAEVLNALRTHLVARSVARVPRVAGSAPPLWIEPRKGTPAPGEGQNPVERGANAVLAIFQGGGVPVRPYESWHRLDLVDIWLRTKSATVAFALEAQLRDELADRRDWLMGGLQVIESTNWRALQRVSSDEQSFTFTLAYLFEVYA